MRRRWIFPSATRSIHATAAAAAIATTAVVPVVASLVGKSALRLARPIIEPLLLGLQAPCAGAFARASVHVEMHLWATKAL
jgi:hypothetical protein